jgi:hypothetical protein
MRWPRVIGANRIAVSEVIDDTPVSDEVEEILPMKSLRRRSRATFRESARMTTREA